jgi:hypothetical protein
MRAFRVSVAGAMLAIALLAIDCAVVGALKWLSDLDLRVAYLAALPMANLSAAGLAFAASRLARRGEVALPLVTFALVGGVAVLAFIATATLAPYFFFEYLDLIVGFYRGPRMSWIAVLLGYGAMTPPLLIPPLLGGWLTRGYRLRLVRGPEGNATPASDPDRSR